VTHFNGDVSKKKKKRNCCASSEMTSSADQMFARERADERTQLEEREAIGKVPISLSASLQVWLPIELSSVVESLWASQRARR
jgi:hypothetical protein